MYTIYLVVELYNDPKAPFPLFYGADVYSYPASGLTTSNKIIRLDVASAEGIDYFDALNNLLKYIENNPYYKWAEVWINDTPENINKRNAHMKMIKTLSEKLSGLSPFI